MCTRFILNSKNFLTVLISSNKHFSYAIKINLEIRYTACCKLYITKHDCTAGHTFKRYDDHIAWRRHIIINEFQIPKLSEYIRIDHQLYMKFFLHGYICQLTKTSMLHNFPSYLNNQDATYLLYLTSFRTNSSERIKLK